MVRPKKTDGTKRNHRVDVRMTSDEHANLCRKATERGLSVSDYIRLTVLDSEPIAPKATPDQAAMIRGLAELPRIGNNLNQITHAVNLHRKKTQSDILPGGLIDDVTGCLKSVSDYLHNNLSSDNQG